MNQSGRAAQRKPAGGLPAGLRRAARLLKSSQALSKAQARILALLGGSARGEVYANARGGLDTAELLEKLRAVGLVKTDSRRQAMFTVWRACAALVGRGLLKGTRGADCNNPGGVTNSWEAAGAAAGQRSSRVPHSEQTR